MIYIRKIFTQDLRNGKQIAFPKEPSNIFFHFNFTNSDPERSINFKFKERNSASAYYIHNNNIITTRLYSAGSESRIDGQLKQFLTNILKAKVDDVIVFCAINETQYEFEFIPQGADLYNSYKSILKNKNHEVALVQVDSNENDDTDLQPLQKIFYGAPGTGKSHKIKGLTKGKHKTATTFHPDTDYSTFVGSYKPQLADDKATITYSFVPQAFAKAYVNAWKKPEISYYLIIEEINRGNCAQIFGDIFQLLDRSENGYSDYVIDVDQDFADYIKSQLSGIDKYMDTINELSDGKAKYENGDFIFSKIALPHNLYIWATMNTSDQSLFPMDSAFKRRWDWEYLPIEYTKAKDIKIEVDGIFYNWDNFLRTVNLKIKSVNASEDKQIGPFFVKTMDGIISFEQFRSKVMFYLWFEVYKDESGTQDNIFRVLDDGDENNKEFSFGDLFEENHLDIIHGFMRYIGVPTLETSVEPIEVSTEDLGDNK